jgi:hypothetical protein
MAIDSTLITRARKDLAQRLGVNDDAITTKNVEEVEWKDTSLGCPKRGVYYIQAVTPGYQIVLEANGQTYDYRTDGERLFLCESP